jgi:hypothetical protein
MVFNFHRPLFRSKYASFGKTNKRSLAFARAMAAVEAHLKADHFVALWPKLTACVPEKFSAVRMTPID